MKVAWLYVEEDRRFCFVNAEGRMLNGKRFAPITTIGAHFDPETDRLELRLVADVVSGVANIGEPIVVDIYGNQSAGHLVEGPWTAAVSEQFGQVIRLVRLDEPGNGHDRADEGANATLLSLASLWRLREEAGVDTTVDPRRFRMLIGIDGATPHEEDGWIGRRMRVGGAVVIPGGNVGRCSVTTYDPDTGTPDLDTLEVLARYRAEVPSSEPRSFGIWARVERAGRVALGDDIVVEA